MLSLSLLPASFSLIIVQVFLRELQTSRLPAECRIKKELKITMAWFLLLLFWQVSSTPVHRDLICYYLLCNTDTSIWFSQLLRTTTSSYAIKDYFFVQLEPHAFESSLILIVHFVVALKLRCRQGDIWSWSGVLSSHWIITLYFIWFTFYRKLKADVLKLIVSRCVFDADLSLFKQDCPQRDKHLEQGV